MPRSTNAQSATLADIAIERSLSSAWLAIGILLLSLFIRSVHLDHTSVKPLDEVFHAIVARSLLTHPLVPTFNRFDFVSVDAADWQNAQVWLHKPPLSLWQIALSFAAFGVNAFALRLPSALLATASAGLTYLIAKQLFDTKVALVALLLQSFNPVLEMLVHGYVFSDHVDISLLFWSELSVFFLLRLTASHHRLDALLCGAAEGAAFLSKTFPALITLLLAMFLVFAMRRDPKRRPLTIANVGWIVFATALVAGPWNIYAYLNWPNLYVTQTVGILSHLNHDVEGWAGPWDRLWVDYGWRVFHVFYPVLIVAVVLSAGEVIARRNRQLGFVLAWLFFALLPNTFAVSKPMTATLVGWPAAWLLLAWLMVEAFRGNVRALAGLFFSAVGYVFLRQPMPVEGWGFLPGHPLAGVLLANWQPVAVGSAAAIIALFFRPREVRSRLCLILTSIVSVVLFCCPIGGLQPHGYLLDFWRVGQMHRAILTEPSLAEFVRLLPDQAVIILENRITLEDKVLQWEANRDCWPMLENWQALRQQISDRGGLPYVVTQQSLQLPTVRADLPSGRHVFAGTPQAAEIARRAAHP